MSNNLNLSDQELYAYKFYFQKLDTSNSNRVSGQSLIGFLQTSRLNKQQLATIWELSCPNDEPDLDFQRFCISLKLISLAQNNQVISNQNLIMQTPLPNFGNFTVLLQQFNKQNWVLSKQLREQYENIFKTNSKDSVTITGLACKEIFLKRKIDTKILGQIWQLVDQDSLGYLNKQQFLMIMHIIYNYQSKKIEVPSFIPQELIDSVSEQLPVPQNANLQPGFDAFNLNMNFQTQIPSQQPFNQYLDESKFQTSVGFQQQQQKLDRQAQDLYEQQKNIQQESVKLQTAISNTEQVDNSYIQNLQQTFKDNQKEINQMLERNYVIIKFIEEQKEKINSNFNIFLKNKQNLCRTHDDFLKESANLQVILEQRCQNQNSIVQTQLDYFQAKADYLQMVETYQNYLKQETQDLARVQQQAQQFQKQQQKGQKTLEQQQENKATYNPEKKAQQEQQHNLQNNTNLQQQQEREKDLIKQKWKQERQEHNQNLQQDKEEMLISEVNKGQQSNKLNIQVKELPKMKFNVSSPIQNSKEENPQPSGFDFGFDQNQSTIPGQEIQNTGFDFNFTQKQNQQEVKQQQGFDFNFNAQSQFQEQGVQNAGQKQQDFNFDFNQQFNQQQNKKEDQNFGGFNFEFQ